MDIINTQNIIRSIKLENVTKIIDKGNFIYIIYP